MIQKRKKQLKVILLIVIIASILGVGAWGIYNIISNNNDTNNDETDSGSYNKDIKQEDLKQFELKRLLVEVDGEITETYDANSVELLMDGETKIYSLEYETIEQTKDAYENFKNDENIKNVDVDKEYGVGSVNSKVFYYQMGTGKVISSWGPIAMGLDKTQNLINSKTPESEEIIVAVIDTGLDVDHSYITSNTTLGDRIMSGYNAIDHTTDIEDNDGHGTNVAGIVLESTPNNVKVLPIKALDVNEKAETTGTVASAISAINYAIENDVDIINMSIGSSNGAGVEMERIAIQRACEQGITCIAAAGNGDEEGNALNMEISGNEIYPAVYEEVITVGAVKTNLMEITSESELPDMDYLINNYSQYILTDVDDLSIASFSNYGSALDFVAPGVWVFGLVAETTSGNVAIVNGTSQATPHISAAVATIKSYNKEFSNEEVEEILKYYANDLGEPGKDHYYGNGFVSFKDFQECTCDTAECEEIYCFGCESVDCLYHEEKELESIEITTPPTKLTYTEGETFDSAGMVVTAKYDDGTSQVVEDYTYAPITALTESDTNITISYTEGTITKTATQIITVNANNTEPEEKTLIGIEITTPPSKLVYTEGEMFDKAGMVVSAIYSDGTKAIIGDRYTVFPTTALSVNTTEVTISYTENGVTKTAKQQITVNAQETPPTTEPEQKTLTEIILNAKPTKTTYTEGERFDKTGMVIVAKYSDGTTKIITDYTYTPTTALKTSDKSVTITYRENGITKTTSVAITVKAKATQTNPPDNGFSTDPGNTNLIQYENVPQQGNLIVGGSSTIENVNVDGTTSGGVLVYAGLEEYIIPIGACIIAVMAISYVSYRKYKDI